MATLSYRMVVSSDVVGTGTMTEQKVFVMAQNVLANAMMQLGANSGDILYNGSSVGYWEISIAP